MDRDDFIIFVSCLVCEHYHTIVESLGDPVRAAGFAPQLRDEEVITIELWGELFKKATDKDLFTYFVTHYPHFFPTLKEHTSFVR